MSEPTINDRRIVIHASEDLVSALTQFDLGQGENFRRTILQVIARLERVTQEEGS